MRAYGDALRVSSKQVYRPVATHGPQRTLFRWQHAALQLGESRPSFFGLVPLTFRKCRTLSRIFGFGHQKMNRVK
jgi:hypothetical protein